MLVRVWKNWITQTWECRVAQLLGKLTYDMTQQFHFWAFIPKKWKCIFSQKLAINVHSRLIFNSLKLEIPQMFNGWMIQQLWWYPHHGILFGNKKKQTIGICHNFNEPQENYVGEKANIKRIYIAWFHLCNNCE